MSGEMLHDYWDGFYAGLASRDVPTGCSAFAEWVAGRLGPRSVVAEFGFGTARDSLHFAAQGHRVLGFDFAEHAVDAATARVAGVVASGAELDATFTGLDLYHRGETEALARDLADEGVDAVYGRFLLHSLEDEGRGNLLDLASVALADGGELLLEFRTGLDAGHEHLFGDDHYRAYLDPDAVEAELEQRGAHVVELVTGHGLAVYKTEDPHVARIVARFA